MSMFSTTRVIGSLATVALCVAAAACTRAGDETGASLEQTIAVPSVPAAPRAAMALAPTRISHRAPLATLPPEAGRIVSVRVHDYVDGLRQDITLEGSAPKGMHDGVTVLARTSHQPTLDEAIPLVKPTESVIRSEIGAAFPHLPMQIVERDSANSYGPYGLALGRAGGDVRCLFRWQWIDANRLPADAGVDGPVSVRVHFCQAGTTFDAMASLVDHLTIGGASDDVVALADAAPVVAKPHPIAHRAPRRHVAQAPRAETSETTAVTKMHYEISPPVDAAVPQSVPARAAVASMPDAAMSSDLPQEALRGPQRGTSKPE